MAKLYNENYLEVKRKLDGLNYLLPFDISSCKLVETLVNDIYKLKSDVTKSITEKETMRQKLEQAELSSRASEFENKRILKENQQLHKEMIELSKKLNFSGNAKDVEIKRLHEEKNDLKFLLNETKTKMVLMEKEIVKLKTRLSNTLVKIFDSNFCENNLRKLFNEHVFLEVKEGNLNTEDDNLFNLNYELINQERKTKETSDEIVMAKTTNNQQSQLLEITLPKRSINMTQVLEPNHNFDKNMMRNSKAEYSQGQFNNTGNQQQYLNPNQTGNIENAMRNTFLRSADEMIVKASYTGNNNEGDIYKSLTKKNEILTKQVEKLTQQLSDKERERKMISKDLENSYHKTARNNSVINNDQTEVIIKYLKEENAKLTTKYEERINFIIKENRALQDTIVELSSSIKNRPVRKPAVNQNNNNDVYNFSRLEKKMKQLEAERNSLRNEVALLKEKIERNDKAFDISKYVPKEFLAILEEKNNKMKEDYEKSQELILKLNERIQNLLSSSNSEKVFLKNSIKNLSVQEEVKNSEKKKLVDKIYRIEEERSDLSDKINSLNSILSQKENTINKLNEVINGFKGDFEEMKFEKDEAINKIVKLERDMLLLKRNISLKEGEIDKLTNLNNVFEKENEILKLRLAK